MQRRNVSSGSPWEDVVGYSRAVRVGSTISVSGTTASDADGQVIGGDDAYAQTVYVLRRIERALQEAGAGLEHVVRTRMFVTDIDRWRDVARAHAELLGHVRPAATMVEVSRLIAPGLLIEIEAEARVPDDA